MVWDDALLGWWRLWLVSKQIRLEMCTAWRQSENYHSKLLAFFLLLISLLLLKMIHWSQNFGHFLGILTWSWGFWEKVPDADAPLHPLWLYLSSIFSSLFIHPSIRGIKTCSWYLYRWSDWSQNRMDNGSFSEMYRCILLDWTRLWICFEVGRTFFLSSDIKFLQTKENLNGYQASIGKAFDDVIY